MIYLFISRFLIALTVALLYARFANGQHTDALRSGAFTFMGILFILLGWIAYLRLDGVSLPKPFMKRLHYHKKPMRTYGDMIDYTDEPIVSFDDLEDDEKDICCLCGDAACAVIFLVLSFL